MKLKQRLEKLVHCYMHEELTNEGVAKQLTLKGQLIEDSQVFVNKSNNYIHFYNPRSDRPYSAATIRKINPNWWHIKALGPLNGSDPRDSNDLSLLKTVIDYSKNNVQITYETQEKEHEDRQFVKNAGFKELTDEPLLQYARARNKMLLDIDGSTMILNPHFHGKDWKTKDVIRNVVPAYKPDHMDFQF